MRNDQEANASSNISLSITQKRKISKNLPRVALLQDEEFLRPLVGVTALWSDWSETGASDISLNGVNLLKEGFLIPVVNKLKSDGFFNIVLKIKKTNERIPLELKVLSSGSRVVSSMIDGLSTQFRLRLGQEVKDQLLTQNFNRHSSQLLPSQFHECQWFHGPFDTNILLGQDFSLFEYDNVIVRIHKTTIEICKSISSVESGQSYAQVWQETSLQRVSLGAGWLSRLIKVIDQLENISEQSQIKLALKPLLGS